MPRIPELYLPLIEEGYLKYFKDTMVLIMPSGTSIALRYAPTRSMVYVCFGLTFGRPRDFANGDVLISDDYGFFHKGGVMGRKREAMRWHWDPAVESIYMFEYPLHLVLTETKPLTMDFVNNAVDNITGEPITIIQDMSTWLFECDVDEYAIIKWYFLGFSFLGKLLGGIGVKIGLKLAEVAARISSWLLRGVREEVPT